MRYLVSMGYLKECVSTLNMPNVSEQARSVAWKQINHLVMNEIPSFQSVLTVFSCLTIAGSGVALYKAYHCMTQDVKETSQKTNRNAQIVFLTTLASLACSVFTLLNVIAFPDFKIQR